MIKLGRFKCSDFKVTLKSNDAETIFIVNVHDGDTTHVECYFAENGGIGAALDYFKNRVEYALGHTSRSAVKPL